MLPGCQIVKILFVVYLKLSMLAFFDEISRRIGGVVCCLKLVNNLLICDKNRFNEVNHSLFP